LRLAQAWPAAYINFMAIYHLSVGSVTRSTGRSSVQAAAYLTATCLTEERRGLVADYTRKQGDITWETMAPEWANIDKKDLSIWNRLENYEEEYAPKRYSNLQAREKYLASAVTAHTYVFALPKELTKDQNVSLIQDIIQERFVDKGLVATWAIHWEEGNPHAHIMVSERAIEKDGTFSYYKVARDLSRRVGLKETRKLFADKTNALFIALGMDIRIDHRSFAERGLDLIPTKHKGWESHQRERDGLYSRIGKQNEEISEANKEKIAHEPNIILKELVSTQATFSEMDVIRLAQKRMKNDPSFLTQHVIESVMNEAVEVGTGINAQKRYTTQEYFEKEAGILEAFEQYQASKAAIKIEASKVDELLGKLQEQGKETGIIPNEGQVNGIRTLCGDSQLSVMIGRAGTGKTTTLKPVIQVHEAAGYKIWGMAPSATAASQLEADTGCQSDTIAHYAYYWREYERAGELLHTATTEKEVKLAQKNIEKYSKYLPDSNTLILIDEAGMVGVGDSVGAIPGGWDAIIKAIGSSGAKLILTGDDHQFKPIEAGDVFRRLVQWLKGEGQLCELTEIKRQNVPWMREASNHLAELNVGTALGMYERAGHIQEHASNAHVYEDMARQYLRNIISQPDSKGIVIAATNEERHALNREIRSVLKENGLLPEEDLLQRGEDGYAVGDKIIFTKNDRGWSTSFDCKNERFFVQNNMHAVIQSIKPLSMEDGITGEKTETYEIVAYAPDHEATITFNLNKFDQFAHSYAVTGWKSQGNTLDWVLAKFSRYIDAHGLYVIMTRHREEISMYYSKEDFTDFQSLVHSLGRVNVKDLVVDYSILDENQEYWKNVQDYKEAGFELLCVSTLARSLDPQDKTEIDAVWQNYRNIEADRKGLAKLVLDDWEIHKDYVRQAGLTRESLEIAAGLKKRSLSRIEIQAQMVVEQYAAVSLEARTLWRHIRRTHPGIRAKTHPEWQKFEEVRDQRGVLANRIHLKPTLHRPFLKEAANALNDQPSGYVSKDFQQISYSAYTIKAQAEAHQSKMLLQELLKDNAEGRANPAQQDRIKVLSSYIEARDMFGQMWKETRPKLKEFEGTLLKDSLSKDLSECINVGTLRDSFAVRVMEEQEEFEALANKIGIKLDFEKLKVQAAQGKLTNLIKTYKSSPELTAKLEAAFEINSFIKSESQLEKKPMISHVFQQGIQPKDIARDALEWQKMKLFESLKTEPERDLLLLLDEYGDKCRIANALYAKCTTDVKDKPESRPWHSAHYRDYKAACESRNDNALEIFDQRDHSQVISMAEAMGIRFKDVELEEILSRCEQATRTRHINAYLKGETPESKGEAAVALRQMIAFERNQNNDDTRVKMPAKSTHAPDARVADTCVAKPSVTAQQVFHSGIDFRELQATAFAHGRACALKNLSTSQEIKLFHTLELYEQTSRATNKMYGECIEESKVRTTGGRPSTNELTVKPWETEKFKDYISLVTVQDEQAHQLVKEHPASSLNKVAKEMGISTKGLDVNAHRHSLRQTLQTFIEGDRTNVPMAANEIMNWLEFDRHSDHKHTFKVLREQNLWPNNIQEGLQQFFEKKRVWRQEARRDLKNGPTATRQARSPLKPEYKVITYERRQSIEEINKQLTDRIYELATFILGEPLRGNRKSAYLEFKNDHKVSVGVRGANQGAFMNFNTGVKGGPLKLIEDQVGLASFKDALEWATGWLGGNAMVLEHHVIEKEQPEGKVSTWKPITPVPSDARPLVIEGNKFFNYMFEDGNKETARYAYRDEQGRLLGYVVRLEKPNPKDPHGKNLKETRPLAYCENEKGFRCWKSLGFFGDEKLPYGLEKLAQDSDKPILVVEGEKTADAAQKLLPGYHVLGWIGGAGSISKTNWGCLVGREVVVWPDHDHNQGSQKAAQKLEKLVTNLNKETAKNGRIGIVNLPEYLSNKWDLADKLPKGWTLDTVINMIREALPKRETAVAHDKGSEGRDLRQGVDLRPLPQERVTEPQVQYSPEEQQVLAYLKEEVAIEKHVWLKEDYANTLLESAKENPIETLDRWQRVSGDYSFKPSITENPLQKEQAEGRHPVEGRYHQENHKALEEKILAYLQSDVSPEKHVWLKEKLCRNIFNVAEKDPITGLKEWQDLSNDYSFNPFREYLSEREICVQDYLQKALIQEGGKVPPQKYKEMLSTLLDKPLEAYQQWHHLTGDKTFNPVSGTPKIEMEAQELMPEAKEKAKTMEASKRFTPEMETRQRDPSPNHEMDR
jgi:ATP-dependent exoDNAse (exonuclease V) alpha subunit